MPSNSPSSQRDKFLEFVIGAALVLWAGLVFYYYFHQQKPLDLSFLRPVFSDLGLIDPDKLAVNSLRSLGVFFLAVVIFFTLWRWGKKAGHCLGLSLGNSVLRFSMEAGLGILFFNGFWLGLGLNHLWFRPLLSILALLFFLGAAVDFIRHFPKFQKLPRLEWPGWLPLSAVLLGLACLMLSLGHGWLPEIYYDGLIYHLASLSFWQFHHGLADFHGNLYSYYPFGAELYFLNGYYWGGSEAAKTLNVLASALAALAAGGWIMEEAGAAYACLAGSLVLFFPWVTSTVWTTQNDVLLAFFLILLYYALNRWAKEKAESPWAWISGILGGAVLTIKYTAFPWVGIGFLALGLTNRDILSRKRLAGWAVLLALMFLSLAPWVLKNYFYAGNGFYPYFSSWLGGQTLPAGKMAELMNDHQAVFLPGFSLRDWAARILDRDLDKTIAPLLFSFLPFLFLPGRRRSTVKYLAWLGGWLLLGGFLVSHLLRLMIPAFIVCFLGLTLVLADLKNKKWANLGALLILLYGVISFISLCRLSVNYYHGDRIWLGKQTREEYLEALPQTASYMDLTKAAGRLPTEDQILIAGDSRSLYYPRSFFANSVFDDQLLAQLARREKDGEGIALGLRKWGIEDLVVAGHEGSRLSGQYTYYDLSPEEWRKLDDFIQRRGDLIYKGGLNGIYHVLPRRVERKTPIPNLLFLFKASKRGAE